MTNSHKAVTAYVNPQANIPHINLPRYFSWGYFFREYHEQPNKGGMQIICSAATKLKLKYFA